MQLPADLATAIDTYQEAADQYADAATTELSTKVAYEFPEAKKAHVNCSISEHHSDLSIVLFDSDGRQLDIDDDEFLDENGDGEWLLAVAEGICIHEDFVILDIP